MPKFRNSIIYSPAVGIERYLPPISYLHTSINRSYRNTSNADTKKPCFLDFFLIRASEYDWWKQPENVYLPLELNPPVFANGTSFTEIPYSSVSNTENEFIRNGKIRRKLLLELATIKIWWRQYQNAILYYQNEISRINRLKLAYKNSYSLPLLNTQTGQYDNTDLIVLYQDAIDRFNLHSNRLLAIQYEVEQRIVYFDANNELPTSILTPNYAEYYSTLTYDLRSYQDTPNTYRNSNLKYSFKLPYKMPHHFLLPEVVEGNPVWAKTNTDIRSYLVGEDLVLAIDLRLGFFFYVTPSNNRVFNRYNTSRFYNPEIWDLDGESFPLDNFYSVQSNVNTGKNLFRWRNNNYGVVNNDQNKYGSSVVLFNPKFDKASLVNDPVYYGMNPISLKTEDSGYLSNNSTHYIGAFIPSIFESFFQAAIHTVDPFTISQNQTYFLPQEIDHRYGDQIRVSYWAQNFLRYDQAAIFGNNEFNLNNRQAVPGWQLSLNEVELNTKIINSDTSELFYKRSAVIDFPTTTLQTLNGVRKIEPTTSFYATKYWFGSDVTKPTVFPQVKFYVNDSDVFNNVVTLYSFRSQSPNPDWLLPTTGLKVKYDFVSNSLIETYYYTLNYTDNNNIPQQTDITLYTITYDISQG
jgi:hypothetical protein